jgi:hypothetical protein
VQEAPVAEKRTLFDDMEDEVAYPVPSKTKESLFDADEDEEYVPQQ